VLCIAGTWYSSNQRRASVLSNHGREPL
jgi:hypothetical protein